ncbi:hypothetical protein [Neotamlana laminarinivorans]|uniref:Uncharacterized protein n=1 Tax=Neotamlana laminarinivorans TaxID=2883124 RepID=A0A9X1HYC3_9FLAO|nr:hypothetical protein [Tamlana laminarinivorans]MCB4798398.1 hypothetical protein [Tamlana laminarinivorans]
MNIIEKYDKPFQYGALMLNVVMAYKFFMLWYAPSFQDNEKITSFISLMVFEFVMVHSGIFMAVMPKRISLFIMVPFYAVFAFAFNTMTNDNSILVLYCIVVFNRMRFAFSDTSSDLKARVILNSFSSMGVYFVLIFVVLIFQSLIPFLGLTPTFLKETNFYESITATGEFIEKPHITMCFGVLYYIGLSIVEAYFLSWNPLPEKSNSTKPNKNYKKLFENKDRIRNER